MVTVSADGRRVKADAYAVGPGKETVVQTVHMSKVGDEVIHASSTSILVDGKEHKVDNRPGVFKNVCFPLALPDEVSSFIRDFYPDKK